MTLYHPTVIDEAVEGGLESPADLLKLRHRLLGEPACRKLGLYPLPADFKLSVVIPVYLGRGRLLEVEQAAGRLSSSAETREKG